MKKFSIMLIGFINNNGTGGQTAPITATYGQPMPAITASPVRLGYNFAGYFETASGLKKYYNADRSSASVWDKDEDSTLYVQWVRGDMVWVSGGTFEMGKEVGITGSGDITNWHRVTLSDFYIGQYEVTQVLYQTVMGSNPSTNTTNVAAGEVQGNRPVERVIWYDALVFWARRSGVATLASGWLGHRVSC